MATSAYTKTQKKPIALADKSPAAPSAKALEQALLALESACMFVLDGQPAHDREDVDALLWQRKFKNVATPVSLALRECRGPRHFHQHYRHSEDDDGILHPVLDDPLETLALTCKTALSHCQNDFSGLQDPEIIENRVMLEAALKKFLLRYKESQSA